MKSKRKAKTDSPGKGQKKEINLISAKADRILRKRWVSLTFLGALLLIAFVLRLSFLKYYQAPLAGDAAIYGKIAWGIKNGHGLHWWSMVWSPFYPFMISLFSLVAGNLESAAYAASLLLGSLVVVPFFFLARRIFDYRAAYLGSVLVVFFPALIVTSAVPLSEATYTFFLLVTLLAGWLLISKRSYVYAFLFGLFSGICYLTRPEFLVGFVFVLLLLVILELKKKSRRKTPTLALFLVCLIGFLILAFPYVKFMHSQSGHWILSGKTAHNVLKQEAYSRGLSYLEQRKAFARVLNGLTEQGEVRGKVLLGEESIISFMTSPGFLGRYFRSAWMGVREVNLFFLFFLFTAIYYIFSWKVDQEGWSKRIFLLCGFSPMLTMPVFFAPAGRLIEPYSPLLILLSVGGILNIRRSLARISKHSGKARNFSLGSLTVLLVLGLLSIFSLSKAGQMAENHRSTFRNLKLESEEFKKLGLWADGILPESARVMFLSGDSFFFYCNRITYPVPFEPFERMVKFAADNRADYLVVSLGKEASWREDLFFLLEPLEDGSKIPEDDRLRLIDVYTAPSGLGAVVYKLVL
jgi:4-amino-4-deoxy-L-arabinose transferase-like glycosyltransferase